MKIVKVFCDNQNRRSSPETYRPESFKQIEHSIRSLDGKLHTIVMLFLDDETYLAVGGGNNGLYNVEATYNSRPEYFMLTSPESKGGAEELLIVLAGQEVPFEKELLVDFETALGACRHWAFHGDLDSNLKWTRR